MVCFHMVCFHGGGLALVGRRLVVARIVDLGGLDGQLLGVLADSSHPHTVEWPLGEQQGDSLAFWAAVGLRRVLPLAGATRVALAARRGQPHCLLAERLVTMGTGGHLGVSHTTMGGRFSPDPTSSPIPFATPAKICPSCCRTGSYQVIQAVVQSIAIRRYEAT